MVEVALRLMCLSRLIRQRSPPRSQVFFTMGNLPGSSINTILTGWIISTSSRHPLLLTVFMKKDNVNLDKLSTADRREVQKRIKTWMARQLYRMQGYYEVNNLYDQSVIRAVAEVKKPATS